jgi:hypothetical protein
MFKKIFLSALLVGMIAILIVGAFNRTQAKWQEGEARIANGAGIGRGAGNAAQSLDFPNVEVRRQGQGRGSSYGTTNQGFPEAYTQGEGQVQIDELVEFTGQVTGVDSTALIVTTASGEILEIANRAWLYAQEQGFTTQPGDTLNLTGFYETDGRLEVTYIENVTNGATLALRDDNGRPMWAGRGRRGS